MTNRFYVTTPIYYVNDAPHLGTAYTTIVADALARFHKLRGARTRFLTGTDEHGLKLERAARDAGEDVERFVDRMSAQFREAWPKLHCEFDDFIRTTEPRHVERVQALWKRCADRGDIYLGHHEGHYCVACETFYTEKDLVEGTLCPIHKRPVEWTREPSYFFKLSKYAPKLLELYERRPEMVQPEGRRNEVVSFLKSEIRDLSISRTSFKWGIPVPGDPAHVIFVWFDALANYLTALGDGELRETFWPVDVHLVGKDIIRFHSVYWPAFLLSAGYPEEQLPRAVFAHGFINVKVEVIENGQRVVRREKMSKTLRNALDPLRLARDLGADEVRYYLLREFAFGQDGDFGLETLIDRIRSELGGALGNLLHRCLGAFVVKHFEGKVPAPDAASETDVDRALRGRAGELAAEAARAWAAYEPQRAIEAAIQLAQAGNKYFDECAPWALAKDPAKRARLATVLYHVLETLRVCSVLLWPVLPRKMDALRAQLGLPGVAPRAGEDQWPLAWGGLAAGTVVAPGQPLFRNISKDDEAKLLKEYGVSADAKDEGTTAAKAGGAKDATAATTPATATANTAQAAGAAPSGDAAKGVGGTPTGVPEGVAQIQYADFEKVELRLGHVKSAERVPKKDRLLRLAVDLGEPSGPRTIIAGIALAYAPEQLVGKQIVVVANLAPRDFGKGLVSHGMLLACGPTESLSIVTLEKEMPAGTRVK